jgi:hypothetical protein
MSLIHIYLDNARYHHAKLVKQWLACNGARIKLHFMAAYSPHLNPIERLRGAMHKNLTHNKSYGTLIEFQEKVMNFLKYDVPRATCKMPILAINCNTSPFAAFFALQCRADVFTS